MTKTTWPPEDEPDLQAELHDLGEDDEPLDVHPERAAPPPTRIREDRQCKRAAVKCDDSHIRASRHPGFFAVKAHEARYGPRGDPEPCRFESMSKMRSREIAAVEQQAAPVVEPAQPIPEAAPPKTGPVESAPVPADDSVVVLPSVATLIRDSIAQAREPRRQGDHAERRCA